MPHTVRGSSPLELPPQIGHDLQRVVRRLNRLTVQFISTLRQNQVHQLTGGIDVAQLQSALQNRSQAVCPRLAGNRLPNVVALESEFNNLRLGAGNLDMILLVMSYHDIYFVDDFWPTPGRNYFFAQIHRALKPGGVLAIVDHAAIPGTGITAVQKLHRIDETFARTDIESAGFRFTGATDALRNREDDRTLSVFDDAIRGRTDRFVYRFVKP